MFKVNHLLRLNVSETNPIVSCQWWKITRCEHCFLFILWGWSMCACVHAYTCAYVHMCESTEDWGGSNLGGHGFQATSSNWRLFLHCSQRVIARVWGISYAVCRAINNILLWCRRVFLLAWHLRFNSGRGKKKKKKKKNQVPYLRDLTNTSHLKRIQIRNAASVLPQPPLTTAHGNTVTLADYTLLLLCILITQPSECL